MAEESDSPRRYGGVLLAGFISLVVGVAGGVAVNRLTERHAALEYELATSARFAGEKEDIAILGLTISNPADREVENLSCSITLGDLQLREMKVVGLSSGGYSHAFKDGLFQLSTPFLNPKESFSVQFFVSSPKPEIGTLQVIVRGKGVTGVPRNAPGKKSPLENILPLIGAAAGALLPLPILLLYLRRRTPRMFFLPRHRGDQHDVVAFVFTMHGFHEEARWARNSERRLSYWAEADRLTEAVLEANDQAGIQRAIKCLQDLLYYASMQDTSELLIHFDISRLAAAINDSDTAFRHLSKARHRKHPVIEKRIEMDERLSKLANQVTEASA